MISLITFLFFSSLNLNASADKSHHRTCALALAALDTERVKIIQNPSRVSYSPNQLAPSGYSEGIQPTRTELVRDPSENFMIQGTSQDQKGLWIFIAGKSYFYKKSKGEWPQRLALNPEGRKDRLREIKKKGRKYEMSIVSTTLPRRFTPEHITPERDQQLEATVGEMLKNFNWPQAPEMTAAEEQAFIQQVRISRQGGFSQSLPLTPSLSFQLSDHERKQQIHLENNKKRFDSLLHCFKAIEYATGISYRDKLVEILQDSPKSFQERLPETLRSLSTQ